MNSPSVRAISTNDQDFISFWNWSVPSTSFRQCSKLTPSITFEFCDYSGGIAATNNISCFGCGCCWVGVNGTENDPDELNFLRYILGFCLKIKLTSISTSSLHSQVHCSKSENSYPSIPFWKSMSNHPRIYNQCLVHYQDSLPYHMYIDENKQKSPRIDTILHQILK